MKLSEAIRLAGVDHPQAYGVMSIEDRLPGGEVTAVRRCALGGAYLMAGGEKREDLYPDDVADLFPILNCQVPSHVEPVHFYRAQGVSVSVLSDIMFLNDTMLWTRNQIADWVENLENLFDQQKEASHVRETVRR